MWRGRTAYHPKSPHANVSSRSPSASVNPGSSVATRHSEPNAEPVATIDPSMFDQSSWRWIDQDSCHDRSRSRSASAIGEELRRDVDAVDSRRRAGFSAAPITCVSSGADASGRKQEEPARRR
jgi:hypothetical protein